MSFFCISESFAHSWGALKQRKGLWEGQSPLDPTHPHLSTGPVAPFGSSAKPNSQLLEIKVGDEQCPTTVPLARATQWRQNEPFPLIF